MTLSRTIFGIVAAPILAASMGCSQSVSAQDNPKDKAAAEKAFLLSLTQELSKAAALKTADLLDKFIVYRAKAKDGSITKEQCDAILSGNDVEESKYLQKQFVDMVATEIMLGGSTKEQGVERVALVNEAVSAIERNVTFVKVACTKVPPVPKLMV